VGPLTDLLKTAGLSKLTRPFHIRPKVLKAFAALKGQFTEAPMLQHYNPALLTQLEMNALRYRVLGILLQLFSTKLEARWHLIAFFLKKITLVQLRYNTYNKELIAIVLAMEH
jgi:hypothetical protein